MSYSLLVPVLLTLQAAAVDDPDASRTYQVALKTETESHSSDGSRSSSRSNDVLVERVVSSDDDLLVLEYDLPADITPDERDRTWEFPARVAKRSGQPFALLNEGEIAERNRAWRERAGIGEEYCGTWYFTWNAFKVECDPEAVLETLRPLDFGHAPLRAGDAYTDRVGRESVPLQRTGGGRAPTALTAVMSVDPTVVRKEFEETRSVVAQIVGPSASDAARPDLEDVSGTVTVTFVLDERGRPLSRNRVVETSLLMSDGTSERRTTDQTVSRTPAQ